MSLAIHPEADTVSTSKNREVDRHLCDILVYPRQWSHNISWCLAEGHRDQCHCCSKWTLNDLDKVQCKWSGIWKRSLILLSVNGKCVTILPLFSDAAKLVFVFLHAMFGNGRWKENTMCMRVCIRNSRQRCTSQQGWVMWTTSLCCCSMELCRTPHPKTYVQLCTSLQRKVTKTSLSFYWITVPTKPSLPR